MAFAYSDRTILSYYGFMATYSVGFIWPIFTLFLLWNDLSFTEIGLLSAVSAVLVVVLEVPTGYLADRIGRRRVLLLGLLAMAASLLGFVVAAAFWQFVVLYALWSISTAFHSGTADAWLYDTLRESVREDEFTRIRGRGGAIYEWTSAATMIVGGLLYVLHPTYPFVASAALHGFGMAIVVSMPRNERYRTERPDGGQSAPNIDQSDGAGDDAEPAGSSAGATASFHRTLSTTRRVLFSRKLRLFVGFVACFFAVVQATDTYIQPITETLLADALESVTVAGRPLPEPALLGVLYATFAAVGAIASDRAGAVYSRFGSRSAVVWLAFGVAVSLLVPWFVALLAIPVFVLLKGAYALSKPLVTQYVNDHAATANRATVLSATSMTFALVRAPLKPVSGIVADATSPIATVALLGVGLLGAVGVVAVRSDWLRS
nr:MFS transporter [Halovivax ruber]